VSPVAKRAARGEPENTCEVTADGAVVASKRSVLSLFMALSKETWDKRKE
jgi:hypothetical protein